MMNIFETKQFNDLKEEIEYITQMKTPPDESDQKNLLEVFNKFMELLENNMIL